MKSVWILLLCALIPTASMAQSLQPIGLTATRSLPLARVPLGQQQSLGTAETEHRKRAWTQDEGGTPRWVKWGLVGAAGGAVLFAVAGQSSPDASKHSLIGDAAYGAATGFVVIGGAIWVYDRLCSRGSRSRAAGMCG